MSDDTNELNFDESQFLGTYNDDYNSQTAPHTNDPSKLEDMTADEATTLMAPAQAWENPAPKFTFAMASRNATTKRINFADMSTDGLYVWVRWFEERHEQDYSDLRQRSYFRVNYANLKAELSWRHGEIPF